MSAADPVHCLTEKEPRWQWNDEPTGAIAAWARPSINHQPEEGANVNHPLCNRMCLDVGDATGPVSEVTQPVAVSGDANAIQLEVIAFAMEGTSPTITCQPQGSNDMENWSDVGGTAPTVTALGRTLLASDTSITTTYIRYQFTISGTSAKAIFAATLSISSQ